MDKKFVQLVIYAHGLTLAIFIKDFPTLATEIGCIARELIEKKDRPGGAAL